MPDVIQITNGALSNEERQQLLTEAFTPYREDFQEAFEWDPIEMCEAFTRKKRGFSFVELERSLNESAGITRRKRFMTAREALTTSSTPAAISLIVIHTIQDAYVQTPAIFRDIAEIENSNGDSEVYPEEFMDDLPVLTAETEPAPESRMGSGEIRIKNYIYTRALAISKRYFELDKTGMVRRFSTNFGKKAPIAQDRAFVNAFFQTFVPARLFSAGGFIPGTNIAGFGPGNGFGTGSSYAGVTGVSAAFNPQASQLTPAAIENALIAPATFVDPYGVELNTGLEFDTLLCDSLDRFKAKRFVQSQVNPVQLISNDTTGQSPGGFTDNVLKGEFTVAHSPYVKKTRAPLSGVGYPWGMFKKGDNGLVMQIEKDWETEQEVPGSGRSFDERCYRWQIEGRFGTGPRTGRLAYVGN